MTTPVDEHALAAQLRRLPAVDQVLHHPAVTRLLDDHPRDEVVRVVRAVLDEQRAALRAGQSANVEIPDLALALRERLYARSLRSLRRVINATGIVLHTGLGRAPLSEEAIDAIADVAAGYCTLELDLETGRRGSRHTHARELLRELTGADDALVVNNNAAASFLALHTLAAGREVLISRGQLVEIGGSYRLPDIMAAAHCRMVEVGTTNRTRIDDYEKAVSDLSAVLLRVHTSNYRIVGFTESASLAELVALARRHNLLVVDDLGSGLLRTDIPWPAPDVPQAREPARNDDGYEELAAAVPAEWDEPTVVDSVRGGADLTLFSGDKLLGGPQAGVLVGRADLIAALRQNPLARAFRPGKLTLAALEATLRLYRDPAAIAARVPALRLLARPLPELRAAAERLARKIAALLPDAEIECRPDDSETGGGALAALPFPTYVVAVRAKSAAEVIAGALRRRDVPIIARIQSDALVFDVRTLEAADLEQVAGTLAEVVREVEEA